MFIIFSCIVRHETLYSPFKLFHLFHAKTTWHIGKTENHQHIKTLNMFAMPRNNLRFNFTAEMLPAYIIAMATLCCVGFLIADF